MPAAQLSGDGRSCAPRRQGLGGRRCGGRHRLRRWPFGRGAQPGLHGCRRDAGQGPCHEDRRDHAARQEDRHAADRLQGFGRRADPRGRGRLIGLWPRLLQQCPAVRCGAADRDHRRALRRRRRLFAGADGLHHHDRRERPHVHHRAGGHQGGHRPRNHDGRDRRCRDAFGRQRQRPPGRARRPPRDPAGARTAELPAVEQHRGPRRIGRAPI